LKKHRKITENENKENVFYVFNRTEVLVVTDLHFAHWRAVNHHNSTHQQQEHTRRFSETVNVTILLFKFFFKFDFNCKDVENKPTNKKENEKQISRQKTQLKQQK